MNNHYDQHISVKHWAEEDRPREKLAAQGRRSLSDAELLAIIIASGSRTETAVELSRRILCSLDNDLEQLANLGLAELLKFKGVGTAKAVSIIAAFELGRRRAGLSGKELPKIASSNDVSALLGMSLNDLKHEEFWVVFMNRANKVVAREQISKGGQAGTIADPKLIFKRALEFNAASIILAHNHPSGNRNPSKADIDLTRQMIDAGRVLDIAVLDHVIFAGNSIYSFADEGII